MEDVVAAALGTGGVQVTVEGKASICKKKGLQTCGIFICFSFYLTCFIYPLVKIGTYCLHAWIEVDFVLFGSRLM